MTWIRLGLMMVGSGSGTVKKNNGSETLGIIIAGCPKANTCWTFFTVLGAIFLPILIFPHFNNFQISPTMIYPYFSLYYCFVQIIFECILFILGIQVAGGKRYILAE